MPKFLIEREIPGLDQFTPGDLQATSRKSCAVLGGLGPEIQWVQSYVTPNKLFCVYIAPNEELIREHARRGGFPCNRIHVVKAIIDPTSADTVPALAAG